MQPESGLNNARGFCDARASELLEVLREFWEATRRLEGGRVGAAGPRSRYVWIKTSGRFLAAAEPTVL